MFYLPPSLTCQFLNRSGRFDYQALLHTPDGQLVSIARQMASEERVALYWRLRGLQLTWVERVVAHGAGVDLDRQRRRFLEILEVADAAERDCVGTRA